MFGITRWQTRTLSISLAFAMTLSVWGCGGNLPTPSAPIVKPETRVAAKSKPAKLSGKISEASPPEVIQQLRELLEQYQPQVSIATPKSNEVLQDNSVSVQFNVKDLPIFKDAKLGLGPHLHLFLDDQPYQAVYDASQPVVLRDLAPGTHTIRAFASRPWHESFKNDGAYAQTTFHVFTKTPNNHPNPDLPLLTYSRPQASCGAEPVMLDFYLTNAPLHLVAQEDAKDDVPDWRVQVTVNGDRFVLDRWQPIYLKGFKPGKNWVQLEYIDEKGNPVQNVFNNTARIFTYEPNGKDTLSKLTRGELSLAEARGIVDPNYKPEAKPVETPAPVVTPEPSPSPIPVVPIPKVKEKPVEPEASKVEETPKVEEPKVEEKIPETVPAPVEEAKPKGGFFSRFKRSAPAPAPSVTPSPEPIPSELPAVEEPEEPKVPEVVAPKVEEAPEVKETPKGGFFDRFKQVAPEPTTSPEPTPTKAPVVEQPEESKTPEVVAPKIETTPEAEARPKGGFFNRFKRPTPEPTVSPEPTSTEAPTVEKEPEKTSEPIVPIIPVVPDVKETPTPEAEKAPKSSFFDRFKRPSVSPSIAPSPVPTELPAPETPKELETEETKVPEVVVPPVKETPKGNFFDRFPRPAAKPSVAPSPTTIPGELAEPEEKQPEIVTPEAKETPKGGFYNQFQRPGFMKKPPRAPVVPPIPAPDMIEPPTVEEKEEIKPQPTPPIKEAPQEKFFDRLKRPEVKPSPSPSPVPDVLSVPEKAVEAPKVLEPETPKPKIRETPQENGFERFRRPVMKPSESPVVQEPKVEPEETAKPVLEAPKPKTFDRFQAPEVKPSPSPVVEEPTKSESSETPEFDARSDLERRLGVPLKPPIPTPEKPTPQPVVPKREEPKPAVKFEVPKSSDLFKRRETNPFLKSSEKPTPEDTSEPEKAPESTPVE